MPVRQAQQRGEQARVRVRQLDAHLPEGAPMLPESAIAAFPVVDADVAVVFADHSDVGRALAVLPQEHSQPRGILLTGRAHEESTVAIAFDDPRPSSDQLQHPYLGVLQQHGQQVRVPSPETGPVKGAATE